ncbi:IQCB1 protein, partial [Amia calva]|nr:IQCB1 protein [Amia calva]
MARRLGQSISKTAALVGCSRSAVVSTYQKWSKEGKVVNRDEQKASLFRNLRKVTNSICCLCRGHIPLIKTTLQSDHFLQLMLSEDVESDIVVLSLLQNLLRINSVVPMEIAEKTVEDFSDELILRLISTNNPVVGSAATKALVLLASSPAIKTICRKYEGSRFPLREKWTGKGFDKELGQLLELLHAASHQPGEVKRLHQAASLIQAAWRSYKTRKRMKKLPSAVSRIQKSFRERKKRESLLSQRQKEAQELRQQLQLSRQRALREFRQRQLDLLEIVPAGLVDRFLHEQEQRAAVVIQKQWRGHRERRKFHQQKQAMKEFKAAVTLQRAALRFMQKRRNARCSLSPWKGPSGLTDERRAELKKVVEDYIALHPSPSVLIDSCKELHQQTQEMLRQHLMNRTLHRKAEQHRKSLITQINSEVDLLMNAPGLKDATEQDISKFMSRSVPVAARAKQSHNTLLQFNRWPWWKKLGDEFLDPEQLPKDNMNIDFETLYLGGS